MAALEMIVSIGQREADHVFHDLAQSIQKRDVLTYEHCQRVAGYAERLARRLGWDQESAHQLALAALVHDLGKTWLGNDILLKESALSPEERLQMQRHPLMGAQMLAGYGLDLFFIETVLYHHETYDGQGYPTGLHGEDIPIGARLLAVADVYDALLSARPYKAALSPEEVQHYLRAEAGRRFDPFVVQAFLHSLEPASERVITRQLPAVSKSLRFEMVNVASSKSSARRPSGPLLVGQS
ncbi:MAG TPA: HD-GYP domain-containing protein [Ktedonobacterales bacterium]|nr:HD-GYP domain-containing protein [Ktedonobacterales bacterium]